MAEPAALPESRNTRPYVPHKKKTLTAEAKTMRSFKYPADVKRDEAGCNLGTLPDLPGCATDGQAPRHPRIRSVVISLAGGWLTAGVASSLSIR